MHEVLHVHPPLTVAEVVAQQSPKFPKIVKVESAPQLCGEANGSVSPNDQMVKIVNPGARSTLTTCSILNEISNELLVNWRRYGGRHGKYRCK